MGSHSGNSGLSAQLAALTALQQDCRSPDALGSDFLPFMHFNVMPGYAHVQGAHCTGGYYVREEEAADAAWQLHRRMQGLPLVEPLPLVPIDIIDPLPHLHLGVLSLSLTSPSRLRTDTNTWTKTKHDQCNRGEPALICSVQLDSCTHVWQLVLAAALHMLQSGRQSPICGTYIASSSKPRHSILAQLRVIGYACRPGTATSERLRSC